MAAAALTYDGPADSWEHFFRCRPGLNRDCGGAALPRLGCHDWPDFWHRWPRRNPGSTRCWSSATRLQLLKADCEGVVVVRSALAATRVPAIAIRARSDPCSTLFYRAVLYCDLR